METVPHIGSRFSESQMQALLRTLREAEILAFSSQYYQDRW